MTPNPDREIQPGIRLHTSLWSRVQSLIQDREEQVFLVLSLLIGALAGLTVVAFIVLTERLGMRLYPVGSPAWRRIAMPVGGSLVMGYLLYRYFPDARAVAYRRPRPLSMRAMETSRYALCSASSAVQRPLWRAEFRWVARDHLFKWELASPRFSAAGSGCVRRR